MKLKWKGDIFIEGKNTEKFCLEMYKHVFPAAYLLIYDIWIRKHIIWLILKVNIMYRRQWNAVAVCIKMKSVLRILEFCILPSNGDTFFLFHFLFYLNYIIGISGFFPSYIPYAYEPIFIFLIFLYSSTSNQIFFMIYWVIYPTHIHTQRDFKVNFYADYDKTKLRFIWTQNNRTGNISPKCHLTTKCIAVDSRTIIDG